MYYGVNSSPPTRIMIKGVLENKMYFYYLEDEDKIWEDNNYKVPPGWGWWLNPRTCKYKNCSIPNDASDRKSN